MGYEQLLSVQQHQHALELQQKDVELAQMKAYIEMMEARGPSGDDRVLAAQAALHLKDEEAALMMAAKHKELELMAGLLELREQQIEDLRQTCEGQQRDLQRKGRQLPRARGGGRLEGGSFLEGAMEGSPAPSAVLARAGAADGRRAEEEDEQGRLTMREVQRLRLRLEELESAVGEQNDRSASLEQALDAKSERVKALEEHVRSLQHSPAGTWADSEFGAAPCGLAGASPMRPPAGGGRHLQQGHRCGSTGSLLGPRLLEEATVFGYQGSEGGLGAPPQALHGSLEAAAHRHQDHHLGGAARSDGMPPLPPLPPRGGEAGLHGYYEPMALHPSAAERGHGSCASSMRPAASGLPSTAASDAPDGRSPSVVSQLPTYRSAVRLDAHRPEWTGGWPMGGADALWDGGAVGGAAGAASPGALWGHAAGEAAETGRQSQELLREMRRLRMQMSELERVAGTHAAPRRAAPLGGCGSAAALQSPGMGGASFGPEGYGLGLDGTCGSFAGPGAAAGGSAGSECAAEMPPAAAEGLQSPAPSLTSLAGAAATRPGGLLWRPGASAFANPTALGGPTALGPTSLVGPTAFGGPMALGMAEPGPTPDFAGWEYRPHASGDPTDAAVADLVNRPQGRHRGWRALLCRLDEGVYLCGTRRVHLRADAAHELIEASEDGGESWADLEELMKGTEGTQHALLERARGAAGFTA